MSEVAPPPAVVAAGSVSAFILADADIAELLAPLAPFTTPARLQALVAELASHPHALERFRRKYACVGELCPTDYPPRDSTEGYSPPARPREVSRSITREEAP